MAGKCKYCGFVGTQDEIVDHAGEMCQGDCQPDTMVKNLTVNQQPQPESVTGSVLHRSCKGCPEYGLDQDCSGKCP